VSAPPPSPPAAERDSSRRPRGCLKPLVLGILFLSLLANAYLLLVAIGTLDNPFDTDSLALTERFLLGDADARDKIAVVRVSGVITESAIQYPIRQLEAAAKDRRVKLVVLRVDSPGGTVTASEELYQNILNVRDNNERRFKVSGPKPVSVSMGGLATSGGYYIAVAGNPISAEQTTITGSIGVFAALPNIAKWSKDQGIKVELVKAGPMKASGSFFHTLSPEERQTWQDTVDNAYDRFLEVIGANRPALTVTELRDKVVFEQMVAKRDEKGNPIVSAKGEEEKVKYMRRRADGATHTARAAKEYQLIDHVEDLPAAIRRAAGVAGLSRFKAVVYDRSPALLERLTGIELRNRQHFPELPDLASSLTPRLWYLAPTTDSGLLVPAQ
jgi:protease-4